MKILDSLLDRIQIGIRHQFASIAGPVWTEKAAGLLRHSGLSARTMLLGGVCSLVSIAGICALLLVLAIVATAFRLDGDQHLGSYQPLPMYADNPGGYRPPYRIRSMPGGGYVDHNGGFGTASGLSHGTFDRSGGGNHVIGVDGTVLNLPPY